MSSFWTVLQTEGLKIRKSKVIWLTALAFTIAPIMGGFFMFVLKDPELAENSGLIGAKAQITGEANWPAYIGLYGQVIAVGGLLIFGFVISWIFGREYVDKTAKDLLALPYSRSVIVLAKFVAACVTNILLCIYIVALGFLFGWLIGLPGWSVGVLSDGLYTVLIAMLLTIALSTPVAFFASYGGGYMAPLGFVVFTLVLSQIIAAAGFGEYFPWSVPALYSGVVTEEYVLDWNSISVVLITSLLGLAGTFYCWLFMDQH